MIRDANRYRNALTIGVVCQGDPSIQSATPGNGQWPVLGSSGNRLSTDQFTLPDSKRLLFKSFGMGRRKPQSLIDC